MDAPMQLTMEWRQGNINLRVHHDYYELDYRKTRHVIIRHDEIWITSSKGGIEFCSSQPERSSLLTTMKRPEHTLGFDAQCTNSTNTESEPSHSKFRQLEKLKSKMHQCRGGPTRLT